MDDQRTHGAEYLRSGRMPPATSTDPSRAPRVDPFPLSRRAAARWRRIRRLVLVRRRMVAALLAGLAVLTGVRAASMPATEMTAVVVAADDLPGGSTLTLHDVTTVELPLDAVPSGALPRAEAVDGRVLAAPLREGEPLTDVRLVAPGLLDGYPGLVAAPVRVADPAVVRLLGVGDRVDLVAVPEPDALALAEAAVRAVLSIVLNR